MAQAVQQCSQKVNLDKSNENTEGEGASGLRKVDSVLEEKIAELASKDRPRQQWHQYRQAMQVSQRVVNDCTKQLEKLKNASFTALVPASDVSDTKGETENDFICLNQNSELARSNEARL